MPQQHQDFSARMRFDTVLPEDARVEFFRPTRERIPVYPPPPQKRSWFDLARSWWHPAFAWLLALVAIVAVVAVSWPSSAKRAAALQESATRSRETQAAVTKALEALRAPIPEPIPMPTPYTSWESYIAAHRAPRAELVRLPAPPPRAQLIRLPHPRVNFTEITSEHIDETHQITMPYGTEVLATLRGFLKNENQLPQIGRIGDMYVVGDVPWIWIQVPGTPAPTWVDP